MHEFVIAFVVGIIIAAIYYALRFIALCRSADSFSDVASSLSEASKRAAKRRNDYWNSTMKRTDWFRWGRW